jgi:hypothetical protein
VSVVVLDKTGGRCFDQPRTAIPALHASVNRLYHACMGESDDVETTRDSTGYRCVVRRWGTVPGRTPRIVLGGNDTVLLIHRLCEVQIHRSWRITHRSRHGLYERYTTRQSRDCV